jgi:tripartite-type tricarboxylate transporter receptor subunit TctC
MPRFARRLLPLLSAMVLCSAPLDAQVPKTLRIIVPLSAGGGGDIIARMIAEQVSRTQSISVVVENRPGAGTVLATEYVARAEPDGATLLFTNAAFLINPHVRRQNYDPLKTFEPVCNIVSYPLFVVVKPDSPFRTLADLVNAAHAKPGVVTVASAGPNTAGHIALETLKIATRMDVIYVPFAGTAPAITALLGGHVMALYADYTSVAEQLKNGDLRALSVASAKRFEKLPDVPTVTESGYQDYDQQSWNGLFAPANTPPAVLEQLRKMFGDAGRSEEIKSKLALQGLLPGVSCGADFKANLQQQYDLFGRVISSANLKAQ